ncbi:secreted RxLR effector protein 161-like [Henckelia pumila]|uniref:secreted RxLR effector protein 161-like n=1 Tax=Henckelia pumila TaxID=405737 RepID=UPI003C6E04A4
MAVCKPFETPMEQHLQLTDVSYDAIITHEIDSLDSDLLIPDSSSYQRLIGCHIYVRITRPDIGFSIQYLSQFMHSPKNSHMNDDMHVLGYLKKSLGLGIFMLVHIDSQLYAYCKLDWASCPMSQKHATSYLVQLGSSSISWKTKNYNTVSRSSAEAEYRSMASAISKVVWLRGLLADMGLLINTPILFYRENQVTLCTMNGRTI